MEKPLKCGRCFKKYYCSPECQKKDWLVHKLMCRQSDSSVPDKIRKCRTVAQIIYKLALTNIKICPMAIFIHSVDLIAGTYNNIIQELVLGDITNKSIGLYGKSANVNAVVHINADEEEIKREINKLGGNPNDEFFENVYKNTLIFVYLIDLQFSIGLSEIK
jgi:hypothetical protein